MEQTTSKQHRDNSSPNPENGQEASTDATAVDQTPTPTQYLAALEEAIGIYEGNEYRQLAQKILANLNAFKLEKSTTIKSIEKELEQTISKYLKSLMLEPQDQDAFVKSNLAALINKVYNTLFGHPLFKLSGAPLAFIANLTGIHENYAIVSLAQTCKAVPGFFADNKLETAKQELQLAAKALQRVLDGKPDEVKKITKGKPELLIIPATATDRRGCKGCKYTEVSPFQAALMTGNVWMVKDMVPQICQLDDGPQILENQFFAVFPRAEETAPNATIEQAMQEALNAHAARQQAAVFNFEEITKAIEDAEDNEVKAIVRAIDTLYELEHKMNPDKKDIERIEAAKNVLKDDKIKLNQALNAFREAFIEHVINEPHANPYHLLKARNIYEDDRLWQEPWNADKRQIFWCQIFGFPQRKLTSCGKQTWHVGVADVVNSEHLAAFSTEEKLRHEPKGRSLFDEVDYSGVGFNYAAVGWRCWAPAGRVSGRTGCVRQLEILYRAKSSILLLLCSSSGSYRSTLPRP